MTRYLISFDDRAMTFPQEDLPDVAEAALAVVQEAMAAGAWVLGAGLTDRTQTSIVTIDGTVTDDRAPEGKEYLGGFAIVDVPSRAQALQWAARFAVACRCTQSVREFVPDPRL